METKLNVKKAEGFQNQKKIERKLNRKIEMAVLYFAMFCEGFKIE
jgi:hypothetical protein